MRTQQPRARESAHIIGAGVAALPVYLWVLEGDVAEAFWSLFLGAILVIGVRAAMRMPAHRAAWLWILAGQFLFLLGDLGLTVVSHSGAGVGSPFTFADWFYLAGYPAIAIGLGLLLRVRGRVRDVGGLIDGLIVAVAGGIVLWAYVMAPTVGDDTMSITDRLVSCAYPAGDLLLITIGAQIAVRQMRRGTPFQMLTASMVVLLGADLVFLYLSLYDGYTMGTVLDAGWWISYVLVAAAAVHPDAYRLAEPLADVEQPHLSGRRLLLLAAIALVAPVLLALEGWRDGWPGEPALYAGTVATFLLVVVRLVLVTHELEASRSRLLQQATHDSLTGLTNRVTFADRIAGAIEQRRLAGPHAAVLFIDLDDFKSVNDSLGHEAGDRLLRIIAMRLERLLRPGDIVARFGGDEFAILIEHMPTEPADVDEIAGRVIDAIRLPIDIGADMPIYANASVGIAFVDSYHDVDAVLADADTAMYLAKRSGKGRHLVFEPGMRRHVLERLQLRVEVEGALERGELAVRYQPVARVATGAIEGFETLLRWNHPVRGEMGPSEFLRSAEECDLLVPIGRWVLDRACRDAQTWSPSPHGPNVSVNIGPEQLADDAFGDDVRRALVRTQLAPDRLVLELTESAIAANSESAAEVLRSIRRLGVRIALDDFGSGYTSLEQLLRFPIDIVKFDSRFVSASLDGDLAVLRGLIKFAHGLGIDTVGDGIETFEQFEALHDLGCRFAQGYLVAMPESPAEALRLAVEDVHVLPCPWRGDALQAH